jgi:hypothetical protein
MGRCRRCRRVGRVAALAFAVAFAFAGRAAMAQSGSEPMMLPEDSTTATHRSRGLPSDAYVAEVVDSTFFVGPAEFFALDLPTVGSGVEATHLSGTVTAMGKGDIIVRLFSGSEYDRWLKKRGGREAKPFWVSSKARTINIQNDLPVGEPVVLLLDNGYSIRTPKRVHCQLQIEFRRLGGSAGSRFPSGGAVVAPSTPPPGDDVVPTPRSNEDENTPPPPPPPPDESGK